MAGSTLLLGVIAAATVVMAVVQIGVMVYAARLAGRINRLVDVVEHEIKPTLARVDAVSTDVARVSALASTQAERLDQVTERLAREAGDILTVAHDSIVTPVTQGSAFLAGLRAAMLAFRATPEAPTPTSATRPDRASGAAG